MFGMYSRREYSLLLFLIQTTIITMDATRLQHLAPDCIWLCNKDYV